jgi:Zn-dependent peptidase ImmA (M78 family)
VLDIVNISLQPQVLQWARKRARLTLAELSAAVRLDEREVNAWEVSGSILPDHVGLLADATNTPIGFLYLPIPPAEKLPINDFRTVGGTQIKAPTPELIDTIYDAQQKQQWYRDHLKNSGAKPLSFVGSIKATDPVAAVASKIRAAMGISTLAHSSSENALTSLIEQIEAFGILVLRNSAVDISYKRRLSVGEFRGFALSDEYAPLIFVNSQDTKAAQVFTLAHELVHVWLGISGISNLTRTYAAGAAVEKFCNAVAAELLVPASELLAKIQGKELTDYRISRVATHFRVSALVIIRRLRDVDAISDKKFRALYEIREKSFRALAARKKLASKKRGGGPTFYQTFLPRVSPRFAHALVGSALEGRTLYRDAMGLLGLKSTGTIHEMGKRFGFVT